MMPSKRALTSEFKERIMKVIASSSIPMDVENIKRGAGLKNWESTKALVLELALEGQVVATKTTKGWIFAPARQNP